MMGVWLVRVVECARWRVKGLALCGFGIEG